MYKEEAHVFQAIKAGAQGYILKGADMEELLKAIRSVRRGEPMIDASIAGRVLVEFAALVREQERQDYLALSKRQTEILQLLARGGTNKDIAETLLISEFTVRNALSAIFEKLHVNNRTEAAVCAVEKGLLDLN
jgi:DNA-binding NarL/FixJ family response regulator